ncbi:unnamed protein product [Zymoseptoria tritici ST99CH_3D7]|uniref:Uncharacterized protein n=1 Tax=Zymoseptoria tritici (strain ST99CH_3D7) TaxID=1276538 RepID=A0A1X7S954_ZYMT9|nr:unnamed protein product [Zymoseptoria tritici ST99CH_3D7]
MSRPTLPPYEEHVYLEEMRKAWHHMFTVNLPREGMQQVKEEVEETLAIRDKYGMEAKPLDSLVSRREWDAFVNEYCGTKDKQLLGKLCLAFSDLAQFLTPALELMFIAAKYLMDDPLHVVVIDGMREWMITKNQERFADQVIELAWSETERGCGLQRVVLDGYLAKIEAADVRGVLEAKFPEFVVDLAARLVELRRNGFTEVSQYTVDKCYYHDHQGSKCT